MEVKCLISRVVNNHNLECDEAITSSYGGKRLRESLFTGQANLCVERQKLA